MSSFRWSRNDSLEDKLLHSPAVFDLRGVKIAFGIGRHVVKHVELPSRIPGVTPAALSLLNVYLEIQNKRSGRSIPP
jgi:hypothetical protein